ncbi:hypothetical protein JCM8097_003032 [Rhodosporidiobolus ruineniae]
MPDPLTSPATWPSSPRVGWTVPRSSTNMPPRHASHRSPLLGLERHAIQFADYVLCFGEKEELDTLSDATPLDPLARHKTLEHVKSGHYVFLRPTSTSSFRAWPVLLPEPLQEELSQPGATWKPAYEALFSQLSKQQWEALQADQTEDCFAGAEWHRRLHGLSAPTAAFPLRNMYHADEECEALDRHRRRRRECLILLVLREAHEASMRAAATAASSRPMSPRLVWLKKLERFDLNTVEGIDAKGYCTGEYRIKVGTEPGEDALPFTCDSVVENLRSGKLVFAFPPALPARDKDQHPVRDWPALLTAQSSAALCAAVDSGQLIPWTSELHLLFSSVSQEKWDEVNLAAWEDFLGYHELMRRHYGGRQDSSDCFTARRLAERFHMRYQECLVLQDAYSLVRDSLPPSLAEKPPLSSLSSEKTTSPGYDLKSSSPGPSGSGSSSISLVDKLLKQAGWALPPSVAAVGPAIASFAKAFAPPPPPPTRALRAPLVPPRTVDRST